MTIVPGAAKGRYLLVVVNWRYCRNHWYDFRLEQRACSKEKPMSFIGRLLRGLPTWQPANKNLSTLTDAFHSKINKQTNLGVSALADYGNSFDSSLSGCLGLYLSSLIDISPEYAHAQPPPFLMTLPTIF